MIRDAIEAFAHATGLPLEQAAVWVLADRVAALEAAVAPRAPVPIPEADPVEHASAMAAIDKGHSGIGVGARESLGGCGHVPRPGTCGGCRITLGGLDDGDALDARARRGT